VVWVGEVGFPDCRQVDLQGVFMGKWCTGSIDGFSSRRNDSRGFQRWWTIWDRVQTVNLLGYWGGMGLVVVTSMVLVAG
jgi:hypothetical protein